MSSNYQNPNTRNIDRTIDNDNNSSISKRMIDNVYPLDKEPPYVSDYYTYGTYSGADIKVYVYVPKSNRVKSRLNSQIETLKKQLKDKEKELYEASQDLEDLVIIIDGVTYPPEEIYQKKIRLTAEYESIEKELATSEESLNNYDNIPNVKQLGELQTISWSVYREKSPVRTLGSVYPRSFTRGGRTIAGTMVFTIFHKHVLHELLNGYFNAYNTGTSDYDRNQYTINLPDQIPPIDISLIFANEYGAKSHMGIYGVEFVQDGGTFSIEDIFSENVVQYVARDIDPMRTTEVAVLSTKGPTKEWTKTSTQLMADEEDLEDHNIRRNPFI